MIITIDGSAGTGKTTVAKAIAERLSIAYCDTGAMYRVVTLALLKRGIDIEDREAVQAFLQDDVYSCKNIKGTLHHFLQGRDVTFAIRRQKVTHAVSAVASSPYVRDALLKWQREFATSFHDVVFEGRDMGTRVFPDADLKIFLVADVKVCARRRFLELCEKHPEEMESMTEALLLEKIKRRDAIDRSRTASPLKIASDAHQIDTTYLSIEEVVDQIAREVSRLR